jgi:hypothetical protein
VFGIKRKQWKDDRHSQDVDHDHKKDGDERFGQGPYPSYERSRNNQQ